jgi:hypothetical protein
MTLEEASRGKSLSLYYSLVEKYIQQNTGHKTFAADAVLVADTKGGRLLLRTTEDIWILAVCTDLGVHPDYQALESFGITRTAVEEHVASA